jgi:benzodiazapine receptor
MNRDILRQISIIIVTIITLTINSLATTLPLNNKTTAELSDSFLVRFVPAGYVFSVWGIIYMGLIAYTVWQALPKNRENDRLRSIGWWFVIGSIANTLWLVFWHYQYVAITLPIMLVLLGTLIYTVIVFQKSPATSLAERICVDLPFSIYLGWISVATVVNATVVLFDNGVTPADDVAILCAIVLVFVAIALAVSQRVLRRDTAYGMVIAWAVYGLGVKQGIYLNAGLMPAAPLLVMIASYAAQALALILAIWWVADRISGLIRKRTVA